MYLADHGSTDDGLMDHVDLLFKDYATYRQFLLCYIEHIYVYVFSVLYLWYSGAQVEVAKQCDIKAKQITSYCCTVLNFGGVNLTEINSIENLEG